MSSELMHPITEDDIANYLVQTPVFFERHAQLLANVQLTSPHGQRAVSLQERQAEMLREKIKGLERRIMEMIRHGNDNMTVADRMQRWTITLLAQSQAQALPDLLTQGLLSEFLVPQVALRLWGVAAQYAHEPCAQAVSDDVRTLAASLTVPYCGVNAGFEAVQWLAEPALAQSLALIPLRQGALHQAGTAFGMLVLASPDAQRFAADMGTDFLERIAELASAALSRLL